MEKVNADFDGFWAFVGNVDYILLGNEAGASMKGKVEAFLITIMSNEVE